MYILYIFDKKIIYYCVEIVIFFYKVMCFYFKVKVNKYVLLYIEIFGVWIISIFGGIYVCVVFI